MTNFITNTQTKQLKKRLAELISGSDELKFLVGFFYFSGLRELYEALKNNPHVVMKVLVGLQVDRTIFGLIEHPGIDGKPSFGELQRAYLQSLRNSLNSEDFDTRDFYEQAKFFIDLLKSGRLVIRKTREPNHAKLYIFNLSKTQIVRNKVFITGSSNLTSAGLSHQSEFNVEISDYGTDEAEEYFDSLWSEAIPITEDDITRQKLIETLEKETLIREITPFEAYVLVLSSYIESFSGKDISQRVVEVLAENGYRQYRYQLDAVRQALSIIEQNNGVIIADVVGLGKTIIACATALELKKRGIVIAPPGLIGDDTHTEGWNKYLEEFHLTKMGWKAFSVGKLDEVLEYLDKTKDIEVVIVDEAHRFRNENTKSYELLKNICRGRTVILLTATPFNNKPSDIFSLLKLFITPKKSTITLTDDLEGKFESFMNDFDKLSYIKRYWNSPDVKKAERAKKYYEYLFGSGNIDIANVKKRAHELARQIKTTIEPVTIRRNRLDLLLNPHYKSEIGELPKLEDPQEWFFELTPEQSAFYDRVINSYFALPEDGGKFKGAIYRPFAYKLGLDESQPDSDQTLQKEENFRYLQQFNLYDFMRRLLVKRFESSFGAFKRSLEKFREITEVALRFIEKTGKYILDRRLLEKIYELDVDEIEEYLIEYKKELEEGKHKQYHEVYEVKEFKAREKFLADIESDKRLFEMILEEMHEIGLDKRDPKAEKLIERVKDLLKREPDRKVVIFSEYVDTVRYLEPILTEAFGGRVLAVAGNLTKEKCKELYRNFDASYPKEKQENKYDILLTSDKLSEGFNLNRAGVVINYDIPWNPVRVIQRVGRINRISKKVFDKLYIVNFFPTEQGADLVKSREIAQSKMFLIHNALGEDSKIFDIDEEPSPSELYRKLQQNPDLLEEESLYTKILKELEEIKQKYPGIVEAVKKFPPRVKVAKQSNRDELFVFIKKGKVYTFFHNYLTGETGLVDFEEAIERIKPSSFDEPAVPLSEKFWDVYELVKSYNEVRKSRIVEHSVKQKAINTLKTLLRSGQGHQMYDDKLRRFIEMLLEDIFDYSTLPDYTLRRIAQLGNDLSSERKVQKALEELKKLKTELGEDYLEREKERLKKLTKEIIVAIENRRLEVGMDGQQCSG
ncbi:helicase-related protein [Fervidobacterium thailandense]|uniref:Helicase n=1 Tax=Fervidobacterium thailandense TaxID=1008305 RepID=A0A1E3G2M9_9BACT|nr:helicase-related protein [Fervidobacterium thailandense]ODN30536.1 helicase [Fervidobacterium thailandense]